MSATSNNSTDPPPRPPDVATESSTESLQASTPPSGGTSSGASEPSTSDIPDNTTEIRVDELSKAEGEYVENRPQRLTSDLLEQKYKLQSSIFHIAIVIICVFYFCFLITVIVIVSSPHHELYKLPATVTVLIGMLGSIPTILTAFLMSGLFKEKDGKDKEKDDKAPIDLGVLAKVIFEVAKATKKTH